MEITEIQCVQCPHTAKVDMEAHDADPADGRAPGDGEPTVMCLDLSAVTDPDCLMSSLTRDKPAVFYGGYVLALNRSETEQSDGICLEKRFKSLCDGSPLQEDDHTVPNKFLLPETQEPMVYLQTHKWVKDYNGHPAELTSPNGVDLTNSSTCMCGQGSHHVPPLVDHQNVTHTYQMDLTNPHFISGSCQTEKHHPMIGKNAVTSPAGSRNRHKGRRSRSSKLGPEKGCNSGTAKSRTNTRENHNRAERERRKRIRSSCDKLKELVPFCHHTMDKASTLQLTTDFLTYIQKAYGDAIKQEYKKYFRSSAGTSSSPDQDPDQQQV